MIFPKFKLALTWGVPYELLHTSIHIHTPRPYIYTLIVVSCVAVIATIMTIHYSTYITHT